MKKYFISVGKYTKDGQAISKEEYMKASNAYKGKAEPKKDYPKKETSTSKIKKKEGQKRTGGKFPLEDYGNLTLVRPAVSDSQEGLRQSAGN